MVIGNQDTGGGGVGGGAANNAAHPSGIPQDQIDNIMSGIQNTGDVKMNNHRKKLRQRFDIIKKLGQGTYGKVQLGINKETGQEVAIKTIKKCKIEAEADLVRIRREVQIMSSVQHPNIIHIYEVFENREKMVLVMEFAAGGELYDYLSERKVLNEEEARRIFRQVATAVYYCHKHKICHRDLKLENILLDEHGNAKIADFGLSNVFDDQRLLATFCGSPLYASPEIVEGTPYHGPEVDCWSLGVLLYTLVYGSMPFDGSNFKRLVKQISQGDYYEPKKPSRASSLIREMLTVCPRKRATIEQICSHWWVNENDNVSCLELAEDLANQTPVRLDVLLSLTPVAVTADQLVVPSADGSGAGGKIAPIPRSHSVGSIREVVPNTEAERRIMDMVAAGGEAALMPSPTRTITPAQSPIQTKRKLENTISTDNATAVALKKKEKPANIIEEEDVVLPAITTQSTASTLLEEPQTAAAAAAMDIEEQQTQSLPAAGNVKSNASCTFSAKDMQMVGDLCEQLIQEDTAGSNKQAMEAAAELPAASVLRQRTANKLDSVEEAPEETKGATKVIKKFVNKHKTADLINAIGQITPTAEQKSTQQPSVSIVETQKPANIAVKSKGPEPLPGPPPFVRKCSLQDEAPLNKFNAERRKSRILETAEKFQQMNANNNNNNNNNITAVPAAVAAAAEKPKKIVIPGVNVGTFKKEFERKASTTAVSPAGGQPTAGERRALEQIAAAAALAQESDGTVSAMETTDVEASDSKASVSSFSLDDARRSMENSIALLRQAQTESSKDVNSLCAKTENISVSDINELSPTGAGVVVDRERKLKNARAIIGNAIQPAAANDNQVTAPNMKTSTASITLKSATLPRQRKNPNRTEIQLDIKQPASIVEQPNMRFTTEMQHPVADLRSAPPREGPVPYSPIKTILNARASSLEPKEHIIPIQKPQAAYTRTTSNTTSNRSGSLSRQSTNDSESDTTTTVNMSQSTVTGSSQPIKKSPREFIIPIAVEGGGFITPREGSIEPSESSHTTATTSSRSTFSRLRPTRRIGSLLSETGLDEGSPFQKLRSTSINRDGADDDQRFTLHKLRSSRPVKKISQDNDSQSSGEEDDDDGFEILTAENLFSTLLQRVRALTNRMNVNNDITTGFPSSSRLLSNMRQAQSPFWNQEPFGSRLNNAANSMGAPWRHSMSRDLGSDMESMFSRTGATLPRGNKTQLANRKLNSNAKASTAAASLDSPDGGVTTNNEAESNEPPLDLADLDLSRLRLSKKDLETLSSIAPGLPKCFQEQLLAKLPPTQARKLSRTLSMQNEQQPTHLKLYKRSKSGGRSIDGSLDNKIEENDLDKGAAAEQHDTARSEVTYRRPQRLLRTEFESSIPTPGQTAIGAAKNRSSSVSRDDGNGKSLCSLYPAEISDKYKYYSPYLNKTPKEKLYANEVSFSNDGPSAAGIGRPPSGRVSPPPAAAVVSSEGSSTLKRASQRRISRLLKPDFFEQPLDEERAGETLPAKQPEDEVEPLTKLKSTRHVRNKSMDAFAESTSAITSTSQELLKRNRRSLSRPRDLLEEKVDKHELADKILQELQLLSAIRSQHEQEQQRKSVVREIPITLEESPLDGVEAAVPKEKTATIKKVKKIKPKEKSTDSTGGGTTTDGCTTTTTTTVVVKKVKKVVKKSDSLKTPTSETAATPIGAAALPLDNSELDSAKKESKLKRPKSYPMKDSIAANAATMSSADKVVSSNSVHGNQDSLQELPASSAPRESRLMRPKSYPSSKLSTLKETKKTTRSGPAISRIDESPTEIAMKPSADDGCTKPATIKKIIKVTKKSKLSQPGSISTSSVTPTTTSATTPTSSSPGEQSKESSPATVVPAAKEKSPEKKPGKGLLYALGQKFEKFRASASSTANANVAAQKKSCSENNSSPEKAKEKTTLVKKKKSLAGLAGTGSLSKSSSLAASKEPTANQTNDSCKPAANEVKAVKADKRSRIDSMIRNLRERSVPRSQTGLTSESNYIKRAVSVEEMPGTFNKKSVNRVLGLFKRFEKDPSQERKVRNTRSTSNIERQIHDSMPCSPIYQNADAIRKLNKKSLKPKHVEIPKEKSETAAAICHCELMSPTSSMISRDSNCPECLGNGTANLSSKYAKDCAAGGCIVEVNKNAATIADAKIAVQGNKDKRKGLMLDLLKIDKTENSMNAANVPRNSKKYAYLNDNGIYSNLPPYPIHSSSNNSSSLHSIENSSNNNNNNNNSVLNNNTNNSNINSNNNNNNSSSIHTSQTSGYRTSSTHEINRNNNSSLLSPSFENIANYSSDSRSYQDDCASTSTFLSPTEERELYFDNWSVCSEDNYRLQDAGAASPSSRLARTSQISSPTRTAAAGDSSDPNESVIDRIKRRSFYCRFNEKKPKRTSSIVGPNAVREYYREQQAAVRTHSTNKLNARDRETSPDITQEFLRPLKLSPIGTELKPPVYRGISTANSSSIGGGGAIGSSSTSHDYSSAAGRPRKSLTDIRTPPSPSFYTHRRYGSTVTSGDHDINSILNSKYKSITATGSEGSGSGTTTGHSAYYNTYNPKRRSSYTLNGRTPSNSNLTAAATSSVASTSTHIDGYATLGRRPIRAYDHRTMSLMEPSTTTTTSSYRREARTPVRDYTTSLSRSNSRYRTSSTTRSPTNI